MTDDEQLQQRAAGVLAWMKDDSSPGGPFFIEFAGTPKSGKSSCIDSVSHFFRRMGFQVHSPSEGASRRTPRYLKEDLTAFNTWSACHALTQILEALHHSDRYHIAILDRGLFDSLVWFDLLSRQKKVAEADCAVVQQFLLLAKWRESIDLVVLFKVDPKDAMSRENRNMLIEKHGRAMNPEFLGSLNEAYDRVNEQYGDRFRRLLSVDTSDVSGVRQVEAATTIVDTALGILEAEAGIGP
jgi:thymidylate kinase